MNLLIKSEMGCPDGLAATDSLRLQRLLWIYCLGHAGVRTERTDRLTSTTHHHRSTDWQGRSTMNIEDFSDPEQIRAPEH